MKKIIYLFVFLLSISLVLAQAQGGTHEPGTGMEDSGASETDSGKGQVDDNKGIHEPGTGLEDPELKEEGQGTGQGQGTQTEKQTKNQGEETELKVMSKTQTKAKNTEELKQMIQQRKEDMQNELKGLGKDKEKIYQNQNRVREAVHSLLAMEDLVGGIGKQVSEIAKEFNNSVQSTIKAEEKIQSRSGLSRFFAGGDKKTAEELEKEANQNKQKIQQLKQLRENCDCDNEVKELMQEQIQNMEQEQNRLSELAQKEKKSKGLFGWLWK